MANKKITELTAYTAPVSGDVLPINDSTPTTKKITVDNLFKVLSSLFRLKDSSDTTKQLAFDISGFTTETTRTITIPDATSSMVNLSSTQTLTNKTLTAPVITSPTINLTSDAEGDTYYRNAAGAFVRLPRGTDNYILKMNGNVPNWETETAVIDASTTVKGVVEAATSAEVSAGTSTGGTGAVLVVTPDIVTFSEFGTGADGSLTYDGSTTILGMAPSSSIYTLTRDIYGTTITINNGVTIETGGYRIFAKTSLTNNGTIKRTPNNGGNASADTAGSGGAALSTGTIYGGLAGASGGNGASYDSTGSGTVPGNNGGTGTSNTSGVGVNGVAGGTGGTGSTGGSAGTTTASKQGIYSSVFATSMFDFTSYVTVSSSAGSGGGGAGGYTGPTGPITTGAGGGSGSAGGIVWISARVLTNSGTISANGGNGGNGSASTGLGATGGGGGGGGSGGVVVLMYKTITLGTVTVTGGTGGTNGGGTGSAGTNGNTGVIYQIAC